MAMYVGEGDWRSIAEQASKETDPAKLMNDRRSFVGD